MTVAGTPHRKAKTFDEVVAERLCRRGVLKGALGVSLASFLGGGVPRAWAAEAPLLGFAGIPISRADTISLPPGYTWQVVNAWGDPIVAGAPEFKPDASQSAADQAMQSGMHHDGMHFFPLPRGSSSSSHGLLAVNFEYTDDDLLHHDGMENWSAEKVQKSKNAHGIGVMEIRLEGDRWLVVRNSRVRPTHHRRHAVPGQRPGGRPSPDADGRSIRAGRRARHLQELRQRLHPVGHLPVVRGELHRRISSTTPARFRACRTATASRRPRTAGAFAGTSSTRASTRHAPERAEPLRLGRRVRPLRSRRRPVKHTAMGRMAHEGAALAVAPDGRVVYYMGDETSLTFEHIYKFVSAKPHVTGGGMQRTRISLTRARSTPPASMPTAPASGSSSRKARTV